MHASLHAHRQAGTPAGTDVGAHASFPPSVCYSLASSINPCVETHGRIHTTLRPFWLKGCFASSHTCGPRTVHHWVDKLQPRSTASEPWMPTDQQPHQAPWSSARLAACRVSRRRPRASSAFRMSVRPLRGTGITSEGGAGPGPPPTARRVSRRRARRPRRPRSITPRTGPAPRRR